MGRVAALSAQVARPADPATTRPYTVAPDVMATRSPAARALRHVGRWSVEALHRLSPSRVVPLPSTARPTDVALVCVYRSDNAALVGDLLRELPAGAPVRLWALDAIVDEFAEVTVGSGPGGRLELLNRLVEALPGDPQFLIVSDDDVDFAIGSLGRLLHAGAALGFDVFQPSHTRMSVHAFRFVRRRFGLFARETEFVEQGPVVVLSRAARGALLPLPGELGMGWGLEARWASLGADLRFGVIDAVGVRHVSKLGHTYDTRPQLEQLRHELAAIGLERISQLQVVRHSIRPLGAWRQARRSARGAIV